MIIINYLRAFLMLEKLEKNRFRDNSMYQYYRGCKSSHKDVPPDIENIFLRKLDMLYSANSLKDLMSPPGNKLEKLNPKDKCLYSIRVNSKYRIIFTYKHNEISDIYLDQHEYKI